MLKIKVLYIGSGRYPIPPKGYGAVEKHIWNLSKAMRSLGHEVYIINNTIARNSLDEYRFALLSTREAKKIDYDVLHLHTAPTGLVYSLLGYKFVYTSHSRHWSGVHSIRDAYGLNVEKHNIKYAKEVISLTEEIKKKMGGYEKIHVIPNGVDVHIYKPSSTKNKTIVLIGEVSPRKDIHTAFKALKGTNVNVVVIGPVKDKEYLSYLKSLIPDAIFTGEIDELKMIEILSSSMIFLHPSRSEGLSMAIIEAMSCGLPVICSDVSSSVVSPENGFIFYSKLDENQIISFIKEKVELILNDENLAKAISIANRKKVENFYSWESIAKEVEKVYKTMR
ncbi:MAG: glycosyltransferase family 4 protein [Thermoplasmata archaeon]